MKRATEVGSSENHAIHGRQVASFMAAARSKYSIIELEC